jgi:hypothetical protein
MVIGLCVMALGVALVLDRLGIMPAEQVLQYWPIGLVLLGASMVLQALRTDQDGGRRQDFPVGAAIWLVLLGLLFTHTFERRSAASRDDEGGRVSLFALLSGDRRSPAGERFRGANLTALMGGVRLDLTQAEIPPGEEAVIDVFTMMGGAVVFAPRHWIVEVEAASVMGGISDNRNGAPGGNGRGGGRGRVGGAPPPALPPAQAPPDTPPPVEPALPAQNVERPDSDAPTAPPRLVIRGLVIMGGLTIRS